jgi:hypothetical protein
MTDKDGGGEVMTDTGLQIGCLDEIPGVFRLEYKYEVALLLGGDGDRNV